MTDLYDRATEVEELDRAAAILRQRQMARAQDNNAGVIYDCIDCGEVIPSARLNAVPGCCRCISCAKQNEQLNKLVHG